jgi:hypothetical protein
VTRILKSHEFARLIFVYGVGLTGKKEGKTRLMNMVMQVSAYIIHSFSPACVLLTDSHIAPKSDLSSIPLRWGRTFHPLRHHPNHASDLVLCYPAGTRSAVYDRRAPHRKLGQDGHPRQAPEIYEGERLACVDIQPDEPCSGYLGRLLFVPAIQLRVCLTRLRSTF